MNRFLYEPRKQMLLPHALQDWLPEGHLAYYISDTVDALDLTAFDARYSHVVEPAPPVRSAYCSVRIAVDWWEWLVASSITLVVNGGSGNQPFHPAMMVKVLASDRHQQKEPAVSRP